jgi:hypothetical protein
MSKFIIIALCIFCSVYQIQAQDEWDDYDYEEIDYSEDQNNEQDYEYVFVDEKIDQQSRSRTFKPNLKSRYSSEEFDYTEVVREEKIREIEIPQQNFRNLELIGKILKILGIIILIIVVAFVIRAFVLEGGVSRRGKKIKGLYEVVDEELDFEEVDYLKLAKNAESSGEFKLAVRYYFLAYLQQLNRTKIIDFHPDKTNREYRYEIENIDTKSDFDLLCRVFDYCWYGDHDLNAEQFKNAKQIFAKFLDKWTA